MSNCLYFHYSKDNWEQYTTHPHEVMAILKQVIHHDLVCISALRKENAMNLGKPRWFVGPTKSIYFIRVMK